MDDLTLRAYRLSWLALAVAALCLLGSVVLDRPTDPSAAVMFLFFLCLPVSFLVGIVASLTAIARGQKAALLPLVIFLASAVYIVRAIH